MDLTTYEQGMTSQRVTAGTEFFYQNINDNNMAGEGICSGMRVLVRKQNHCENGKIGLVIAEGTEGTLKQIYYASDTFLVLKDSSGLSRPYSIDEIIILGQVMKAEFDV